MRQLGEVLRLSAGYLSEHGSPTPRLDAELLIGHALGLPRIELYTNFDRPLDEPELAACRALLERRGRREPVAYILGRWGFHGLDLAVDARVLVPRPETEVLVERCLALLDGLDAPRVADVGTGSGAIALAIKAARPDAAVTATDVSADALTVARANAAALGLELDLAEADVLAGVEGRFALVASNPPYIGEAEVAGLEPEVAEYEPRLATVAGPAGTEVLERLAAAAPAALEPGGWLVVECGAGQAEAVCGLLAAAGAVETFAEPDLAGIDRVVGGRWT
ncbi:MAG TPA: peptide chain release factor N(5)-glutamine methyltransferase [Gaiellales bacterium]|nr:peptide chain release factor N(5)-glutamine methyltransferase [Gaiellales bacterium]